MISDPFLVLLSVVVQDLALFLLTVALFWVGIFVARRLGRPASYGLGALGFSKPRPGYLAGVGIGLAVGIGALIMSLLVSPLSTFVVEELGYSTESNVQGPLIRGVQGWVGERPETAVPVAIFVIVLFGPAVEELIFRGAIFGGLYRLGFFVSRRLGGGESKGAVEKTSFALSALFSSGVFALVHLEPVILPALFILAVGLCALYRRTGSLLPCFVAHATFNSFAVLLIILSGLGVLPTQM